MPALTKEDLREQLKRRDIAPVYVLYGAETYLRDLAANTIANLSFNEGDFRDFNETEFSVAISDNLQPALAAAEQLPMMAAKRVVRIADVRVGATSNKDTLKEDQESILENYLKRPAETSVVIFIADELNANRKIGKLLLKGRPIAVEFPRLDDAALRKFAADKIRESGSEADERTVRHLTALTGSDLRRLSNEIEKLSTAALPDKLITIDLIESLVANSRELTNFELTDNLMAGRGEKAIRAMRKILDDGAEPLALLGLISYNYRRLLMAKDLMNQGVSRQELSSAVKLYGNKQEEFLTAARRTDLGKLSHAIKRIAQTDLAIKTSQGGGGTQGSRMQIEILVCELAIL
ncbi:MAG: DNA polymerase III subunit delta [Saprospiraceae bacterium]|nr:DNA polymerase III subunit delta [Pyrinomonadaceae bacterium]